MKHRASLPGYPSPSRQDLLNLHARTFALTLRLLPPAMGEPLGIAYLLARASDTVADAECMPLLRRARILGDLEEALVTALSTGATVRWHPDILPGELSGSEQVLFSALPDLLLALEGHIDRNELLGLWQAILRGQLLDLSRFAPGAPPLDARELENYCGLVAGSVGATWTRLIAMHCPVSLSRVPNDMIALGTAYGKGLQLVNILRDRAADRALGRAYVVEEELSTLIELAREWLDHGRVYLAGLQPGRLRYASQLPHSLALRTLEAIHRNPAAARVKISRMQVCAALIANLPALLPSLVLRGRGNPAS